MKHGTENKGTMKILQKIKTMIPDIGTRNTGNVIEVQMIKKMKKTNRKVESKKANSWNREQGWPDR